MRLRTPSPRAKRSAYRPSFPSTLRSQTATEDGSFAYVKSASVSVLSVASCSTRLPNQIGLIRGDPKLLKVNEFSSDRKMTTGLPDHDTEDKLQRSAYRPSFPSTLRSQTATEDGSFASVRV